MINSAFYEKKEKGKTIADMDYQSFYNYISEGKIREDLRNFTRLFNKEVYYEKERKRKDNDNNKPIFSETPYTRIINFNVYNFYDKYYGEDLSKCLIIYKEEILKHYYLVARYNHYKLNTENNSIWQLAYFLECSSYYKFETVINPSKLGLPEDLKAFQYYELLLMNIMKDKENERRNSDTLNENNSNNGDESENQNSDEGNSDNESNNNDGNSDNEGNNNDEDSGNDGNNNDGNSDNEVKSDESKNGESSKDNESKDSPMDNSGNSGYSNSGSGEDVDKESKEEISMSDIMDYLRKKNLSNNELREIELSFKNFDSENNCGNVSFNKSVMNMFAPNNRSNKDAERYFKKISKFITSHENEVKIVKTTKELSYTKYSWKTDARRDTGIIFAGNRRITGGISKKFKESPVIFFDFSGSTDYINYHLNALAKAFWDQGYTICVYDNTLRRVVEPGETSLFFFSSSGGTSTIKAVNSYFLKGNRIPSSSRNIYVITDGQEDHTSLFNKYPKTNIFRISTDRADNGFQYIRLTKIYLKDGNITESKF